MNRRVRREASRPRQSSRDGGLEQSLSANVHTSGSTTRVSHRRLLATVSLVLLGIIGLFSACSSAELDEAAPGALAEPLEGPRLLFAREAVNLGKVAVGERVQYDFRFRNVGDAPLVVSGATAKALEGC